MKKRRILKSWVEKMLLWVFGISFILAITVNDFNEFEGFVAWLLIIVTAIVSGGLLSKYGRTFGK